MYFTFYKGSISNAFHQNTKIIARGRGKKKNKKPKHLALLLRSFTWQTQLSQFSIGDIRRRQRWWMFWTSLRATKCLSAQCWQVLSGENKFVFPRTPSILVLQKRLLRHRWPVDKWFIHRTCVTAKGLSAGWATPSLPHRLDPQSEIFMFVMINSYPLIYALRRNNHSYKKKLRFAQRVLPFLWTPMHNVPRWVGSALTRSSASCMHVLIFVAT